MAMRARVMDMLLEVGAPLSGRFFQHNFYGYIFKEFGGIIDFLKCANHCNHEVTDFAFCD
jgi:hypothetical protein